jgi:hypothetical protein
MIPINMRESPLLVVRRCIHPYRFCYVSSP